MTCISDTIPGIATVYRREAFNAASYLHDPLVCATVLQPMWRGTRQAAASVLLDAALELDDGCDGVAAHWRNATVPLLERGEDGKNVVLIGRDVHHHLGCLP